MRASTDVWFGFNMKAARPKTSSRPERARTCPRLSPSSGAPFTMPYKTPPWPSRAPRARGKELSSGEIR